PCTRSARVRRARLARAVNAQTPSTAVGAWWRWLPKLIHRARLAPPAVVIGAMVSALPLSAAHARQAGTVVNSTPAPAATTSAPLATTAPQATTSATATSTTATTGTTATSTTASSGTGT